MHRRTFTAAGLAAACSIAPRQILAERALAPSTGFQFAEFNDGQLTTRHQGMATPQVPVTDRTLFQVASCSKTVTALAVMTLVRDGMVKLDQPANRYLRRWALGGPRAANATIAELLSHTAGTTVHGFAGYGPDEKIPTLFEILDGLYPANSAAIRTRRRMFGPFRYSGGGTMVLQTLIEDVTGVEFATYTAREVLVPIGAARATFALRPGAAFARGIHEDGQPLAGGFRRHPESAAAGLWATASDLVNVLQAIVLSLRGARNALLPKTLAKRMVTPVSGHAALGVMVHKGGVIAHEGRNYGYDAVMAATLGSGRIRAAVTNRNGALADVALEVIPS